MSIPLPPLDGNAIITMEQLRARDQEIVRCVLEAAASEASSFASVTYDSWHIANAIRALEFHHE